MPRSQNSFRKATPSPCASSPAASASSRPTSARSSAAWNRAPPRRPPGLWRWTWGRSGRPAGHGGQGVAGPTGDHPQTPADLRPTHPRTQKHARPRRASLGARSARRQLVNRQETYDRTHSNKLVVSFPELPPTRSSPSISSARCASRTTARITRCRPAWDHSRCDTSTIIAATRARPPGSNVAACSCPCGSLKPYG